MKLAVRGGLWLTLLIVIFTVWYTQVGGNMLWWYGFPERHVDPGVRPPGLHSIGFKPPEHRPQEWESFDQFNSRPMPSYRQVPPEQRSPITRVDDVISPPKANVPTQR